MERERDEVNHFIIVPDSDVHEVFGHVGNEMDIDVVEQRGIGHLDRVVKEGDPSVAVDGSLLSQAKDILTGV